MSKQPAPKKKSVKPKKKATPRKAKKKVNEKLGIDENRNKEVESDDIIIEEE